MNAKSHIFRNDISPANRACVLSVGHPNKSLAIIKVFGLFMHLFEGESIVLLQIGLQQISFDQVHHWFVSDRMKEGSSCWTMITLYNSVMMKWMCSGKNGFPVSKQCIYDSMTVERILNFRLDDIWMPIRSIWNWQTGLKALEDVGLLHTIDIMPSELSGGMRKIISPHPDT